jgi:hypothetical protein
MLSIVVRRTFLEIEDASATYSVGRNRAMSDTILCDSICKFRDVVECRAQDQQSTNAGDDSPRSSHVDSWSELDSQDSHNGDHQVVCTCEPIDLSMSPREEGHDDDRTTIMLRNLPSAFSRAGLLSVLNDKGLECKYDFVYLPVDFVSGASLGYAFVNFVDHQTAKCALQSLQGFTKWTGTTSQKVLGVVWSEPNQGLHMLVERFRNSRVMHGIVPDEYKPALFKQGQRIPFPRHTKRIRPPYSGNLQSKSSA